MVLVDSSHESQNLRFPSEFMQFNNQQNMLMKACQLVSPLGVVRLVKL